MKKTIGRLAGLGMALLFALGAASCALEGADGSAASQEDLVGTCVPGCGTGERCSGADECVCGEVRNAPGEGAVCALGEVCESGVCRQPGPGCVDDASCAAGLSCCNNECVDTSSDVGHCGACGVACSLENAEGACVAGSCEVVQCTHSRFGWPTYFDCDATPGCETQRSPSTCGGCGVSCGTGETCSGAGECVCGATRSGPMEGSVCGAGMQCSAGACVAACAPALDVVDDGSGSSGGGPIPNLVISEIDPGSHIELWNTTGSDIDLSGVGHQLCSPFVYSRLSSLAPGVIVPANGYATIPWPAGFTDTDAGGEVILYSTSPFNSATNVLDFVCWGSNPHGSRMSLAVSAGKWSGGCAAALSGGAIHRRMSTGGTMAADYDVVSAPSPQDCSP